MPKPNTRRLDREIQQTERKIEAVRNQEMWPLTVRERRQVVAALAAGSVKVARGKSPGRAERALETLWHKVLNRLTTELTALQAQRQQIVNEAASAKAAKPSFSWW
ncbi:hypothetical protein [Streptomyces chartreusis]|uniref:hypothetical protein n=1 Tax=Streptomyces chartreusis TaxID=1969 RepID=UPI00123CD242|nr:hypothetical protein [Streptomyces chartreusis]QEV68649.1 hypothetical protein CP983_19530 [Streptomyces chartreusis]GGX50117.1 hypothetical protein GCM10010321_78940 [Streptomyces chartreusis]